MARCNSFGEVSLEQPSPCLMESNNTKKRGGQNSNVGVTRHPLQHLLLFQRFSNILVSGKALLRDFRNRKMTNEGGGGKAGVTSHPFF